MLPTGNQYKADMRCI